MYFKDIFYHVTLDNIFRMLNNSVYFQNIVVCNEPLQLIQINFRCVENAIFLVITLYNFLISSDRIQLNGWCNAHFSRTF